MSRLVQLLRYFELPPTASAAELRHAYLQRVKLVHPDVGSASPDEFLRLRQHFDEASELLSAPPRSAAGAGARGAAAWPAAGGRQQSWARAAWPAEHARGPWPGAARPGARARQVPVVGLPGTVVYPATAASLLAAAALPFVFAPAPEPAPPPAAPRGALRGPEVAREGAAAPQAAPPSPGQAVLEAGPWCVEASLAADREAREGEAQRSRAGIRLLRYTSNRQVVRASKVKPVVRDGISMLPVHVAALDGHIWWLERCGATPDCRANLGARDSRGETPLHHAARSGRAAACAALLRLGADSGACNSAGELPGDLAEAGAPDVAALLRGARGGPERARRHPDGLGVLAEPPPGVTFSGLHGSESLRRAVDMAAGRSVAPPLPISRAAQEADGTGERAVNVMRGGLMGAAVGVEDVPRAPAGGAADPWAAAAERAGPAGAGVRGLLLYEPAGQVSPDAPGHWAAVRRGPGAGRSEPEFWRLDPVRGSFRITPQELEQLLARYRAWRIVDRPEALRAARTAKPSVARHEAEPLAGACAEPVPAAPA